MNKYAEFSQLREPNLSNRRCLTKHVYRSEDRAELASAYIYAKLGERQTPYRCPMCFRWHLTSKVRSFHDDQRDDKRDLYPWSKDDGQREHFPGMGRR